MGSDLCSFGYGRFKDVILDKKVTIMTEKYCKGCKTFHDISEFGMLSHTRDKLNTRCKKWRSEAFNSRKETRNYHRVVSCLQDNQPITFIAISKELRMKMLNVLWYIKVMKDDGIITVDQNLIMLATN